MKLNCEVVEKVSAKTQKKYVCLEVTLAPDVKKIVYLTDVELALIKAIYNGK